MKTIPQPVDNFTPGRLCQIDFGVIHSICLNEKCDINVIMMELVKPGTESYHYVIGRSGTIYETVHIKDVAWHCKTGVSPKQEVLSNLNKSTVGIALVGSINDFYTSKQYESLAALVVEIESDVISNGLGFIGEWVGHDFVSGSLAYRAGYSEESVCDPGPKFDWEIFSRERYRNKLLNELIPEWRNKLKYELETNYSVVDIFQLMWKKICSR